MNDPDERDDHDKRDPGTEPPEEPAHTAPDASDLAGADGEVTREFPAIALSAQPVAELEDATAAAQPALQGASGLSPTPAAGGAPAETTSAPDEAPVRAASDVEAPDSASSPAPEPLTARRVAVVRLSGADDGEVTVVASAASDPIIIGRLADDLTVALPHDQWVSRRHAQIAFHDGQWWIQDLHSSNGTYLGDLRIPASEPAALPLGAIFRIGHTDLKLADEPEHLSQGSTDL